MVILELVKYLPVSYTHLDTCNLTVIGTSDRINALTNDDICLLYTSYLKLLDQVFGILIILILKIVSLMRLRPLEEGHIFL